MRDGGPTAEDLELLDTFRKGFDEPLLALSHSVSNAVRDAGLAYLLSGRSKRTKSVIRKLRRSANRNMDLSRMDDIVGIRVLVPTTVAQQQAIDAIARTHTQVRLPFDYREQPSGRYRAVHMVLGEPARRVEIQIRTCAQHYWADACERFGERAKEGDPTEQDAAYLVRLGDFCLATDQGRSNENDEFFSSMALLRQRFTEETALLKNGAAKSYVVVYNVLTNELVRCEYFEPTLDGRAEAIRFYRYQVGLLNEGEFDVLVLNSNSAGTLRVTHPRYFPE